MNEVIHELRVMTGVCLVGAVIGDFICLLVTKWQPYRICGAVGLAVVFLTIYLIRELRKIDS